MPPTHYKIELFKRWAINKTPAHRLTQAAPTSTVKEWLLDARKTLVSMLPLDYMPSDEFETVPHEIIVGPMPEGKARRTRTPPELPAHLKVLYEVPLLTKEQEQHLFRKYNYLKYLTKKTDCPKEATEHYAEAVSTRHHLITANQRLIVSIAKKYPNVEPQQLVSDGNIHLAKAIEKFDYTKGFKFSTYATYAIKRNFIRSVPAEYSKTARMGLTGNSLDIYEGGEMDGENALAETEQTRLVKNLFRSLDANERAMIRNEYGFYKEKRTLSQMAEKLDLPPERARKIRDEALVKLKKKVYRQGIEA